MHLMHPGNTGEMLEFANPISDMEKSYISMYSQYIEKYNNITCYTKTGAMTVLLL